MKLARRFLWILILVAVVGGIGGFAFWRHKRSASDESVPGTGLFTVKRGDLTISVTESGSIKAVKSEDIKSTVEGRVSIVNIVPEGTVITAEDVNNGKVLAELDSSKLKEQLGQRGIDLATVEASYADANEAYRIQLKQNESDVSAANLKVKFALMDFNKYLGEAVALRMVQRASSDPNVIVDIVSFLDDPRPCSPAFAILCELGPN